MENGHIQLPYGYVQKNNEKLYFDLPFNYKKNLLFDKLPYVAQLNNPAIDDVVKGKKNDDLSIQKFLLATDLLEDEIQGNLNMIVTDRDFNDADVRRALDTKFDDDSMGGPHHYDITTRFLSSKITIFGFKIDF